MGTLKWPKNQSGITDSILYVLINLGSSTLMFLQNVFMGCRVEFIY